MNPKSSTRVLFLAPQPFFSERGTPIAVFLAASAIAARPATQIDLLTLKGPREISIPGTTQYHVKLPKFLGAIAPGISFKKLLADLFFCWATVRLVFKQPRYDLIHAVEEAGFIALILSILFKIPYVYDMDSQLSAQVCERWRWLAPIAWLLGWFEGLVVRSASAVIAVCPALVDAAKKQGSRSVFLLQDISLLEHCYLFENAADNNDSNHALRAQCGVGSDCVLILYVGNLESYQGVDLLIASVAELQASQRLQQTAHLAIVGGSPKQIASYYSKCAQLGITNNVSFLGPRPLGQLDQLLKQADIVVSPRTEGINTPMKIYSYLHSGRALLATRLVTHTQVLNDQIACLAGADKLSFAKALAQLVEDSQLRDRLGLAAKEYAQQNCTLPAFSRIINQHYDEITSRLTPDKTLTILARDNPNSA